MDFRYPGAKEDVLSDIDFVTEPGKITAIIGSTGCGKSTLVNLIPRFYDVTGGSIELDGHDIRDYTLSELRESIGFVPQKGILFSGTIASNLRFGKADASDEQIKRLRISHRLLSLSRQRMTGMKAQSHRAAQTCQEVRSRGLP